MLKALRLILWLPVISAISLSGQSRAKAPIMDSLWVRPYDPFKIAGNLYYVGTYDLACYLITTPEGHILINSGLEDSGPMIEKSIEKLNFNIKDVRIMLNAQGHYDHVGAFADLKKRSGAQVMVHQGDAEVLADGGNSDYLFGGNGSMFPPVVVDRILKNDEVVELGGTRIRLLHHPGHTKGASSFLVTVNDSTRTWTVLIANMPTILPQTRLFGMPTYPKVGEDYRYTLDAMKKAKFDLWVAAHASQFGLHDKRKEGDPYRPEAFADKSAYYTAIDRFAAEYERRRKQ